MARRPLRLPEWPVLLAALTACGPGRDNPVHRALVERPPDGEEGAVAFRFAAGRTGGDTRLYVLPGLDEATWRFRTPSLRTERVVGFSRDQDQIYLLTPDQHLAALDLFTGRARILDSSLAAAAIGPTGRLLIAREDGTVGTVEHRSVTTWNVKLDTSRAPLTRLDRLWGGSGRLIALMPGEGGRELTALSTGKVVRRQVSAGPVAVGPWGDVAVVGTDSGLISVDLTDATRSSFIRLPRPTTVIAVSPAGHRYYAGHADGNLVSIDPVEGDLVDRTQLPGTPADLRLDPLGRMLLVRPSHGDSVWLVELTRFEYFATVPSAWREDLPAVAPDGSLLVLRRDDVVALSPDSLVETGRVRGAALDRWLLAAWDPRRPALQLAADTAPSPADVGEQHFVQVASTANPTWAEEEARKLRAAGIQASVLTPSGEEDRYRVVLGPYPTREAAEAIGRKLGLPFWIFTRTSETPPPS